VERYFSSKWEENEAGAEPIRKGNKISATPNKEQEIASGLKKLPAAVKRKKGGSRVIKSIGKVHNVRGLLKGVCQIREKRNSPVARVRNTLRAGFIGKE